MLSQDWISGIRLLLRAGSGCYRIGLTFLEQVRFFRQDRMDFSDRIGSVSQDKDLGFRIGLGQFLRIRIRFSDRTGSFKG